MRAATPAARPVFAMLPRLPSAALDLHNRICAAGDAWAFAIGPETATLGLTGGPQPAWVGAQTSHVALDIGGAVVSIWVGAPLAEMLGHLLGPATADLADLGPQAMAMVVEHAATHALAALEKTLGHAVTVVSAASGTVPPVQARTLRLTLSHPALGRAPVALSVTGPAAGLERVAEMLIRHPSPAGVTGPPNLNRLPFRTIRESPPFRLPRSDLMALSSGRVLALEGTWTLHDPGRVRFPGGLAARIARTPAGLVFDDYEIDPQSHGTEGHSDMDDIPEADAPVPLDNLEVTLTLELDRATMTLAQLSALRQGAILPFRSTDPETVRVMANGAFFARGELLFVDDKIGVRLTQLA